MGTCVDEALVSKLEGPILDEQRNLIFFSRSSMVTQTGSGELRILPFGVPLSQLFNSVNGQFVASFAQAQ
jgi:hypothetical protein